MSRHQILVLPLLLRRPRRLWKVLGEKLMLNLLAKVQNLLAKAKRGPRLKCLKKQRKRGFALHRMQAQQRQKRKKAASAKSTRLIFSQPNSELANAVFRASTTLQKHLKDLHPGARQYLAAVAAADSRRGRHLQPLPQV